MANDHYNFLLGHRYAAEAIVSLRSLINTPEFMAQAVGRLELRAAESRGSFGDGIRAVLAIVRGSGHG